MASNTAASLVGSTTGASELGTQHAKTSSSHENTCSLDLAVFGHLRTLRAQVVRDRAKHLRFLHGITMRSSYDTSSDAVRISSASARSPRAVSVLGCAAATLTACTSAVLRCATAFASASTSS